MDAYDEIEMKRKLDKLDKIDELVEGLEEVQETVGDFLNMVETHRPKPTCACARNKKWVGAGGCHSWTYCEGPKGFIHLPEDDSKDSELVVNTNPVEDPAHACPRCGWIWRGPNYAGRKDDNAGDRVPT